MTGLLVNVQLEILIVENEAPPFLINGKVRIVLLGQQVNVVTVIYLCFNFDYLTSWLILTSHCMNVAVVT